MVIVMDMVIEMIKLCEMEICIDYIYCGLKKKYLEYFSKFNGLKVE